MEGSGRPWLHAVWERSFATEDEADEAYEQFERWVGHAPLEVDRLDGHTVRVYLDTKVLESRAQLVEASYKPTTLNSLCSCGHRAERHISEESYCNVPDCGCRGFERERQGRAA